MWSTNNRKSKISSEYTPPHIKMRRNLGGCGFFKNPTLQQYYYYNPYTKSHGLRPPRRGQSEERKRRRDRERRGEETRDTRDTRENATEKTQHPAKRDDTHQGGMQMGLGRAGAGAGAGRSCTTMHAPRPKLRLHGARCITASRGHADLRTQPDKHSARRIRHGTHARSQGQRFIQQHTPTCTQLNLYIRLRSPHSSHAQPHRLLPQQLRDRRQVAQHGAEARAAGGAVGGRRLRSGSARPGSVRLGEARSG